MLGILGILQMRWNVKGKIVKKMPLFYKNVGYSGFFTNEMECERKNSKKMPLFPKNVGHFFTNEMECEGGTNILLMSVLNTEHTEWTLDFDVYWRIMKGTANFTKKIYLSLSNSFCFVYLCFVNYWCGFSFAILLKINEIFVE